MVVRDGEDESQPPERERMSCGSQRDSTSAGRWDLPPGEGGREGGRESTGWLDGDGKSWEGDERWVEVLKRFGYFLFCPLSFF